jgi:two-component system sensor histidine kinase MtrB
MSGGDLSVRIQPRGRDELAQLVTSVNEMASALAGKAGELGQMAARARQFAGDVSPERRTALTAMTAVAGMLHQHPELTGDAAAAARPVRRRFGIVPASLVGSALRHGGPPVTVTAGIRPGGRAGGQLAVAVRDHGHGLAPAAIAQVFDRFFQAGPARARSQGSGPGLAIARETARLHGGHIHAGSHPGGGAVFTVSLPLDAPGSP